MYLNFYTCYRVSSSILILIFSGSLEQTITSIFFPVFILWLLFQIISKLSNALFKFLLSCAVITISSANITICILIPFTLIPVHYSLCSFIACSMYILNNKGNKLQPCLTPFLITASLLLSFIFIDV